MCCWNLRARTSVGALSVAALASAALAEKQTTQTADWDIKTPALPLTKQSSETNETPAPMVQITAPAAATDFKPAFDAALPANDLYTISEPVWDLVDDSLWIAGRTYKAEFSAAGVTYVPFFGSSAARNFPVRFTLQSVSIGDQPLAFNANVQPVREGNSVVFERGPVTEIWNINIDSIEQTFVLAQPLQVAGDLHVEVATHSELTKSIVNNSVRFSNDLGSVRYSEPFMVDAAGVRSELPVSLGQNAIAIRVPNEVISKASYPVVIDPFVTTETVVQSSNDTYTNPDVAFDLTNNCYLVVWEFDFSATDGDIYCRRVNNSGLPIDVNPIAIDQTTANWRNPSVANNGLADNFMVVAERGLAGSRLIWGRTRNAGSTTTGAQFQVLAAPGSGDQINPSIGGDPLSDPPTAYLIVWERVANANDHDIHAQLYNADSTPNGNVILIDNSSNLDITPRISKTDGRAPALTQQWTIVWARRFNATDYDIWASQVHWNGVVTHTPYVVDDRITDTRNPSVSSLMAEESPDQPRRYVVTYEEDPAGLRDIYATIMRGNQPLTISNLTLLDGIETLDPRRKPAVEVTTNGRFAVAFEEQFFGDDWDLYISQYCALPSEPIRSTDRRRNITFSAARDGEVALAGAYVAGSASVKHFMTVWNRVALDESEASILAGRYEAKNSCCASDITDDGQTNVADLLAVIQQWSNNCMNCGGDANGDTQVNVADLLMVISGWGPCM